MEFWDYYQQPLEVTKISLPGETILAAELQYDPLPVFHEKFLSVDVLQFINILKRDLGRIRQEFQKLEVFKKLPTALDDMWFCPIHLTERLVKYVRDEVINEQKSEELLFRLRIEFVVQFRASDTNRSSISFAVQRTTEREKGWYDIASLPIMPSLVPKLAGEFNALCNEHRIKYKPSFIFPMQKPAYVNYGKSFGVPDPRSAMQPTEYEKGLLQSGQASVTYVRKLFETNLIVELYLDYADQVILPTLIDEYDRWVKDHPLSVILTREEIERRWCYNRNKIEDHLHLLFEKIKHQPEPQNQPSYFLLGVMIHPPDPSNLEVEPFFILEFIEISNMNPYGRLYAQTLDSTGKIFQPEKVITDKKVSTRIH